MEITNQRKCSNTLFSVHQSVEWRLPGPKVYNWIPVITVPVHNTVFSLLLSEVQVPGPVKVDEGTQN